MMSGSVFPAVRRLIAATGFGFLVSAVVLGLGAAANRHLHELRMDLQAQRSTLARLQSTIGLSKQAIGASPALTGSPFASDFLGAGQEPVLLADLQNRLRTMAIGRGVELNSANALPSRDVDGQRNIGLRIVLRGQLSELQRIIHQIETVTPLLFIERATMRLDARPASGGDPSTAHIPPLVVELDIFGTRLPVTADGGTSAPSIKRSNVP